jgi:hypothetical protein
VAKSRRKATGLQRNKEILALARIGKRKGFLSKRTKLHGGRFVSRRVANKLDRLTASIESNYTTVKVPRKQAALAKLQGFEIIAGNRIVVPPDRRFINRVKRGMISGVIPIKGGHIEAVVLPFDAYDMRDFIEKLRDNPKLIDDLKLPTEAFAFRLYGNMSYQAVGNVDQLLKYMQHYRSIFDAAGDLREENLDEIYQNFQLFRIQPADIRRYSMNRTDRIKAGLINPKGNKRAPTDGRRSQTRQEILQRMHPARLQRLLARQSAKTREYREKLKRNPIAYAKVKERARERAKASRDRKKDQ